jgi:predicted Fe-Mo cluster-binding NifX family protein
MRIAVACNADFTQVAGHVGRARRWLVFAADATAAPERLELAFDEVFHYFEGEGDHPLQNVDAIIGLSAGDGFLSKMKKRGVDAVMTAERDPAKAVADYLADQLSPAKPRPIGGLLCKAIDMFSKHK